MNNSKYRLPGFIAQKICLMLFLFVCCCALAAEENDQVVLVFDAVSSDAQAEEVTLKNELLNKIVNTLPADSQIGLVGFDSVVISVTPLRRYAADEIHTQLAHIIATKSFTTDRNAIVAIDRAIDELESAGNGNKSIVVISNELVTTTVPETDSNYELWLENTLQEKMLQLGVKLYWVTESQSHRHPLIETVTGRSGGGYMNSAEIHLLGFQQDDIQRESVSSAAADVEITPAIAEETPVQLSETQQETRVATMESIETDLNETQTTDGEQALGLVTTIALMLLAVAGFIAYLYFSGRRKVREGTIEAGKKDLNEDLELIVETKDDQANEFMGGEKNVAAKTEFIATNTDVLPDATDKTPSENRTIIRPVDKP